MLANGLIKIARSRLGDKLEHRWTNERLTTIVDQGQKDFCRDTGIYRKEVILPLNKRALRYALPEDCMTVNRIEYKGVEIPLFSRNDLDENRLTRKDFVGIKDNLNMNFIEFYAEIPDLGAAVDIKEGESVSDETFVVFPTFGVATEVTSDVPADDVSIEPPYGVTTGAFTSLEELPTSDRYGEISDSTYNEEVGVGGDEFGVLLNVHLSSGSGAEQEGLGFITRSELYEVSGKFGITGSIVTEEQYVRIFYTAIPPEVRLERSALVIHDMWEAAMLRYLVGTALQDDNDANNIQRGELEIAKYKEEVLKAKDLTSKDFSRAQPDKLVTRMRRI